MVNQNWLVRLVCQQAFSLPQILSVHLTDSRRREAAKHISAKWTDFIALTQCCMRSWARASVCVLPGYFCVFICLHLVSLYFSAERNAATTPWPATWLVACSKHLNSICALNKFSLAGPDEVHVVPSVELKSRRSVPPAFMLFGLILFGVYFSGFHLSKKTSLLRSAGFL